MFLTCVVLMTLQRYEKFNRPQKYFSERLKTFSERTTSVRQYCNCSTAGYP